MKLLVVVDKLLTGFDAPPCTYLYIDKSMQDHGLFQAICRTNRLDGEDKDFGYIVDYKDLFKKVENAIAVYTSELDHSAGGSDPEVLLQDRLKKGKERLDARSRRSPCCASRWNRRRVSWSTSTTSAATRRSRRIWKSGSRSGPRSTRRPWPWCAPTPTSPTSWNPPDTAMPTSRRIKEQLDHYLNLREIIRKASGETLDLKAYEADMRHLIDTYIEADEPRKISPFDNMGLLELIVKTGIVDAIAAQLGGLKGNKDAIAETIENNVRSKIIKEHLSDPAYYEKMSALAGRDHRRPEGQGHRVRGVPEARRRSGEEGGGRAGGGYARAVEAQPGAPGSLQQPEEAWSEPALVLNTRVLELATKIDSEVKRVRPDGWRGVQTREQTIKAALYEILEEEAEVERIFLDHRGAERVLMGTQIELGDITVDVVLKDIKNVHLSVYPPTGRVRISAPKRMSLDILRVFAISKLDWIKQQQAKLREQERETPRDYVDRESHYVWGKRYLLTVTESEEPPAIELKHSRMLLRVRPGTDEGEEAGDRRGMVSRAAERGGADLAGEVGTAVGRECGAVLRATDEDQMGELQPPGTHDSPQHRVGQEASGVPGVHRRARAGPPAGAYPQCPLHRANGPLHAQVALPSPGTQSSARTPREVELLTSEPAGRVPGDRA